MPLADQPAADAHEGLRIKIYEAGTTEYKAGFKDNAVSAHALCESTEADPHPQVFRQGAVELLLLHSPPEGAGGTPRSVNVAPLSVEVA